MSARVMESFFELKTARKIYLKKSRYKDRDDIKFYFFRFGRYTWVLVPKNISADSITVSDRVG